ncbi:MAG TPA: hypothetical protein VMX97_08450, partial [Hyphomicrobiaceae bacterium]|nr:hypothetical protein [Hyphomicrobiaceae bacterium]
ADDATAANNYTHGCILAVAHCPKRYSIRECVMLSITLPFTLTNDSHTSQRRATVCASKISKVRDPSEQVTFVGNQHDAASCRLSSEVAQKSVTVRHKPATAADGLE